MHNTIKNKKGVVQLDMRGNSLYIGQSVLVMDSSGYAGRGTVSTGVIVHFDRYLYVAKDVVLLKNNHKNIVSAGDVHSFVQLFEEKVYQKMSEWDLRDKAQIMNLSWATLDKVSPSYVIGCTERFRMEWIDGTIFQR